MGKKRNLLSAILVFSVMLLCFTCMNSANKESKKNSQTNAEASTPVCPKCKGSLVKSNKTVTKTIRTEAKEKSYPIMFYVGSITCLGEKNVCGTVAYESAACDYYSKTNRCKVNEDGLAVHNVASTNKFVTEYQYYYSNRVATQKCTIYYCPNEACKYAVPIAN